MSTRVRQGSSEAFDPSIAVAELADQLGDENDAVLFFCSPQFDLARLGVELEAAFACPIAGCTSSGHIGPKGFGGSAIAAIGLAGEGLRLRSWLIHPLCDGAAEAAHIARDVQAEARARPDRRHVGLLLVDGMSMAEESLAARLYQSLGNIPIIGGSAGDDQRFEKTFVYDGAGGFVSNAALFTLLETAAPIAIARCIHFRPGRTELVITDAEPSLRLIREINGEPAAQAYAEALGQHIVALDPALFASHPLVMNIDGQLVVRSIRSSNPDLSLDCFGAIETGTVATIGESLDPYGQLLATLDELRLRVGTPAVIIAFDCVLRRIEFAQRGIEREIGELMSARRVFGFSCYGEQYNGIHANQTLAALAIGENNE